MRFETRAIHAGLDSANAARAIVPPVYHSTIYELNEAGKQDDELLYSRLDNPNRRQWEALAASLEGGAAAAAFASGIAAAAAVLQALEPGDHVIFPEDLYSGHRMMITGLMNRWKLETSFTDATNPDAVRAAIRPNTRLIWMETPSNPMLRITDIAAVCELARSRGLLSCVDNTWPTPVNQLPLALGADLVMHSSTKYFGGHSDTLGGLVIAREDGELMERIRFIQRLGGAVPSPQDCWMLARSTRTLAYRMKGHNEHGMMLARFLDTHPAVEAVYYPGLESHPGYGVAARQMQHFGGMISFLVKGDAPLALKVVSGSELIKRATSLGGVESSWEHRLSTEGEGSKTPGNLIRFSVGLEHPEDLKEDLNRALSVI
ncbi:MAG: PLP-dependent aspartate aminotransferase family protein [Candidatus Cyclonatronum sp.]|uniref:trans-sulfuration enzyme family protein n=1 Tax=Cyclonatronum sp. TaxID=3024185 RepID=UPI0025BF0703|nr:PLP-dependent transferase [Cyclonatronum sp.]MCC5935091.1 aminotransferase class V-fold PLP-dependent enzyme [Balneolales bacterium]MCH8487343.1 PLP-dependent aspartate aminotransferase family protein [Cyclonatronum sp.]